MVQAEGARTAAGTWAPNAEEAELVELIVDKDEEWEERLKGKEAWINKPAQPPGLLRSGARATLLPTRYPLLYNAALASLQLLWTMRPQPTPHSGTPHLHCYFLKRLVAREVEVVCGQRVSNGGACAGIMELSISMIEARRRQQAAAAQEAVEQRRSAQADSGGPAQLPSVRCISTGTLNRNS